MSYREYAEKEIARLGHESSTMTYIDNCILELLDVLAKQGHSASSANYAVKNFQRLAKFLPLTPLTGEDDEWEELFDGEYRNKRCGRIFKVNGVAYDSLGKAFSSDGGKTWWTSSESHVPIEFPYLPPLEPELVILDEEKND